MTKKYSVGVDFGSLSGRAALIDVSDGSEISSSTFEYPHAVMDKYLCDTKIRLPADFALQHPQDYLDVLSHTVPEVIKAGGISAGDIIGIGIDFTACTMLPVKKDGTPLCFLPEFKDKPHAYVKLWKHHSAQPYADRINEKNDPITKNILKRYGGKISSEWFFPKLWETLDCAKDVYDAADTFVEACDWIIWQLTGKLTRNSCTAGYKAMWHFPEGFPDKAFFASLDPRLENVVSEKMGGEILSPGDCAGHICDFASKLTSLPKGCAVAAANVDAHVTVPALGIDRAGEMLIVMGTSSCHMLLGDAEKPVEGICGCVRDGILPGYYGYEAGQSCVGDHFAWFCDNIMPEAYKKAAGENNLSPIAYMFSLAERLSPGESGILALDWWNGNRSILVDADLSGLFIGMTLATRPEHLFRALVEATAFGTRKIIDNFNGNGIKVDTVFAAGGIAEKNPFMMQLYSDICGVEIKISGSAQAPALGSAIFASVAAGEKRGGYADVGAAAGKMGRIKDTVYKPSAANKAVYDRLYDEYTRLHDIFGKDINSTMKILKKIKNERTDSNA